MDELLKKELERRKEWAAYHHNKMKEEHDSLTDEQHDALSELCSLRHTIHTASEKLFSTESQEWEALEKFLPDEPDNIFDKFREVGIPLDFSPIDPVTLPNSDDYYYVLTETEKEEWEEKGGYDAWREESGVFDEFSERMEELNENIEKFLRKIDAEHGTKYAPSGKYRNADLQCDGLQYNMDDMKLEAVKKKMQEVKASEVKTPKKDIVL